MGCDIDYRVVRRIRNGLDREGGTQFMYSEKAVVCNSIFSFFSDLECKKSYCKWRYAWDRFLLAVEFAHEFHNYCG